VRFANPRYVRYRPGLLREEHYPSFKEAEQRYLEVVRQLQDRTFDLRLHEQ
jgi:hypothetical protein